MTRERINRNASQRFCTVAAIRATSPTRPLVPDGLDAGNLAMPELADLGTTQSVRGYQPMRVSRAGSPWCPPAALLEPAAYPCSSAGQWWEGDALVEFHLPWRDLEVSGVPVHVGEFGHRRPGAVFEERDGFRVDVRLLDLLMGSRRLRDPLRPAGR